MTVLELAKELTQSTVLELETIEGGVYYIGKAHEIKKKNMFSGKEITWCEPQLETNDDEGKSHVLNVTCYMWVVTR